MDKQANPRVSIIIPVYNVEQYLPQCIESCINQTLREIEIILVNDGSTDSSGEICDGFAARYSNIKVIHIANSGVSNARNIGISESVGEFLMFLDSDDWINTETCETAYNKAKETESEIVFWSWQKESPKGSFKDYYLENNSSILIKNEVDRLKVRSIGLLDNELIDPTKTDHFNTPWAKLYNRSFVVESGVRFVERKKVGMEDVLFNIQIFQHVNKVTYLSKYFNHYRIDNPNSLTKVDTLNLSAKFNSLFQGIRSVENYHPRFNEALNNRIAVSLINIMLSITGKQNSYSNLDRLKQTKMILENSWAKEALMNFKFRALPLHWKLFFYFCKYRIASGVFLLTLGMRQLRRVK